MKKTRLVIRLCSFFVALCGGLSVFPIRNDSASAQTVDTNTPPAPAGQPYITNTFEGEPAINVRTGPSTITYPVPCGSLAFGLSAPALGVSPGHEWIEIPFSGCPGNVGWIYAANVVLTGGPLTVVEPPSTPTPLATSTIDPTLQAAFQAEPTETRLPTFTPPAPLERPTFSDPRAVQTGVPAGALIIGIGLVGALVLAVSLIGKR